MVAIKEAGGKQTRFRVNSDAASWPGWLVLCAFFLLVECAGANWQIVLNEEQREELQQFVDAASPQEIYERIDANSVDFIQRTDANLLREQFLLEELVRRNTPDARVYIDKIFTSYLSSPTDPDASWQVNRIVCQAMLSLAELQANNDEQECLKRYDELMQRQLDWDKPSLFLLHSMIANRLKEKTSRMSFDFLRRYEWDGCYLFREILLSRMAVGLTREEQRAHIKRVVLENYDRVPKPPELSDVTPFLAELHHLTALADQSIYQLILLIDEYEANLSAPMPHSAPLTAYLHLLKTANDNSRRHAEFKNFNAIELLYRAKDLDGLVKLAVDTENPYTKADIYEVYLYVKMKLLGLAEADQINYLLQDAVLLGTPANSVAPPKEQDTADTTMNDLKLRAGTLVLDYGLVAQPLVEEALRKSIVVADQSAVRVKLLQDLVGAFTEMAQARARLLEWGAITK